MTVYRNAGGLLLALMFGPLINAGLRAAAAPREASAKSLKAPEGFQVAFKLETLPDSAQVYTCTADSSGKFGWKGPVPDARLSASQETGSKPADSEHSFRVRHFQGPTWQAADGSTVRGLNAKHFTAPGGRAVDWLELDASGGTGRFAPVRYIHRINTQGGMPPATGCDANHSGEQARSNYSATYLFYVPSR